MIELLQLNFDFMKNQKIFRLFFNFVKLVTFG